MIRKYILLVFCQISRDKITNLLNIAGLATGFATFTLLSFYLRKERSYDGYHNDVRNIYRIVSNYRMGSQNNAMAWTSGALAPHLREQLPEVTQAVRLFRYRSPSVIVKKETGENFSEENFLWADANVFGLFTFDFIKGDPYQALIRPYTVVITESISKKYFGTDDPIGKTLSNVTFGTEFEITGVIRDIPPNSHFKADLICSLETLPKLWGDGILQSWGNSFLYSYIKIANDADATATESKINALAQKHVPDTDEYSNHFSLQSITDIHLHSHLQNEWQPNSDITYVYILTLVAILILIVSAINYINLWIARSEHRIKEMGIRLAIGSNKLQVATQFIAENLVYVILAFILSILMVIKFAPLIEDYLGENLQLPWFEKLRILIMAGIGILVLSLVVSLYAIQTVQRISPALAIKGAIVKLRRGIGLWYILIAFQVVVTTLLITGTLFIHRQMSFISNKPAGFDANQLINISLLSDESQAHYQRLKSELLKNPRIHSASACSHMVGGMLYQSGYVIHKRPAPETVLWQRIHVDHDFCKTYEIQVVAGRDFSEDMLSDTSNFIVNESACKVLGLNAEEAIGIEVTYDNGLKGKIIGVMRDFHFKTLHSAIEPLIIHIVPDRFRMLTINADQADFKNTMDWVKSKWSIFDPSSPLVYASFNDFNEKNYAFEKKFSRLIIFFTIVVFILSAMGLIGLNMYITSLKKREIVIRKIFGARIPGLLLGLSKPFAAITLISFILSIPISWYSLTIWLDSFAYKVRLSAELFIAAGTITFILCMVSIALTSIKAAISNPVDVLKDN